MIFILIPEQLDFIISVLTILFLEMMFLAFKHFLLPFLAFKSKITNNLNRLTIQNICFYAVEDSKTANQKYA